MDPRSPRFTTSELRGAAAQTYRADLLARFHEDAYVIAAEPYLPLTWEPFMYLHVL